MLYDEIGKFCDNVEVLSKTDSIKLQRKWISIFANKVKDVTGKYRIGENLWEGFSSGIQESSSNTKAIDLYNKKDIENLYIFDESGKHGFKCDTNKHPEFYNSGYDLYLVPEDFSWTITFCHDNVVYFSENVN